MPSNLDIINAGLAGIQTNSKLRNYFLREYSKVFGEACADCKGKLEQYYFKYINHLSTMGDYVLKPSPSGMISVIPFENDHVTNANVNNTINGHSTGTRMLAKSRAFEKYFEKMPDNVEELIAAYKGVEAPKGGNFIDELVAIKGVGKSSAEKIAADYSTMEALSEAVKSGSVKSYNAFADKALKAHFK